MKTGFRFFATVLIISIFCGLGLGVQNGYAFDISLLTPTKFDVSYHIGYWGNKELMAQVDFIDSDGCNHTQIVELPWEYYTTGSTNFNIMGFSFRVIYDKPIKLQYYIVVNDMSVVNYHEKSINPYENIRIYNNHNGKISF